LAGVHPPYDGSVSAIDWDLAQWVGERLAGSPPANRALPDLEPIAGEFARLVSEYSGLPNPQWLPPFETVDRSAWIEANLLSLQPVLEPLAQSRLGGRRRSATPAARALKVASGLVLGAQVGALTGVLAQRVLGQYDLALLGEERPPRLLLVAPNLDQVARNLRVDGDELTRWVGIHELTHALQFAAADWLRDYLGGAVSELVEGLELRLSATDLIDALRPDGLARLIARLRRGEVMRLTLGERRWSVVERVQSAMSLIEGHAEHVMDAVGAGVLPGLGALRRALEQRRRQRRPAAWRVLERLLGFELKLRQYREGRRFCDQVAAKGGPQLLARAFEGPQYLPSAEELARPSRWLTRVG